eukprot:TRINITY_DN100301_c0_g1_i1.p1 TRINITY_DN100301_c0_g1~~TRINITY_DN100301_c0_g1_i1.p1  ORF type:complete len:117 (+),score=35.28 TRINITY_DN100301_c0_g1_i1:52-402(+)
MSKLVVRTLDGNEIELHVELTSAVSSLKSVIAEATGIQPGEQKALLNDQVLQGDATLEEMGVKEGSEIMVVRQQIDVLAADKLFLSNCGYDDVNGTYERIPNEQNDDIQRNPDLQD